jgi:hypothetical protein
VRDLFSRTEAGSSTDRKFLAAWLAGAFAMFAASLHDPAETSLYINIWRLFLVIACVVVSAFAINEIARRHLSLTAVAVVTVAMLCCGFAFAQDEQSIAQPSWWSMAAGLGAAGVAAWTLRRFCAGSESRERLVLVALVAAQVLADATMGMAASSPSDSDHRHLATFRRSLPEGVVPPPAMRDDDLFPTTVEPETCLLISDTDVPYRLRLALKSVWLKADLVLVRDWDDALKHVFDESRQPKPVVLVDWSKGKSRSANPTGAQWEAKPVGNPQFFEQRQLRAYVLDWKPATPSDESPRAEPAAALP